MGEKEAYEVGSTHYTAPTTPVPGTYEASASSPPDLFPFTESEKLPWNVYAGDCRENEPKGVTAGAVEQPTVFFTPGGTGHAAVPMSYVTLNLYKGTKAEAVAKGYLNLETTGSGGKGWPVTITDVKCAGKTPNNESSVSVKHTQETTLGEENGGHLANPFQPFASELELCIAAAGKTYTRSFPDKEVTLPEIPVYMGQKTSKEKATLNSMEEAPITKLEKEYFTEHKISKAEYEAKVNPLKTKKTNRETEETNEALASKVTVGEGACP